MHQKIQEYIDKINRNSEFEYVEVIRLDNLGLTDADIQPLFDALAKNPEARERVLAIHLSGNNLTKFDVADQFPNLEALLLDHNQISSFIVDGDLPKLFELELSDNPLNTVVINANAPELAKLYFNNTKISRFRLPAETPSLEKIVLHDARCTLIVDATLKSFKIQHRNVKIKYEHSGAVDEEYWDFDHVGIQPLTQKDLEDRFAQACTFQSIIALQSKIWQKLVILKLLDFFAMQMVHIISTNPALSDRDNNFMQQVLKNFERFAENMMKSIFGVESARLQLDKASNVVHVSSGDLQKNILVDYLYDLKPWQVLAIHADSVTQFNELRAAFNTDMQNPFITPSQLAINEFYNANGSKLTEKTTRDLEQLHLDTKVFVGAVVNLFLELVSTNTVGSGTIFYEKLKQLLQKNGFADDVLTGKDIFTKIEPLLLCLQKIRNSGPQHPDSTTSSRRSAP